MIENDFTHALIRGMRAQGAWAEKWPDIARGVKKPFDICAGFEGHFYPIECKLRKFEAEGPLPSKTVVLSPADFRGRDHQRKTIARIRDNNQGRPFVAAFILIEREFKQPLKKGWLIPAEWLKAKDTFTLKEVVEHNTAWGLVWVPRIGWTVPWLPNPDPDRLKEDQ